MDDASGHFTSWFGESGNNQNDVQHRIFSLTLTNTDGSHVLAHEMFHVSTNAAHVVTVNFDKMSLSCLITRATKGQPAHSACPPCPN